MRYLSGKKFSQSWAVTTGLFNKWVDSWAIQSTNIRGQPKSNGQTTVALLSFLSCVQVMTCLSRNIKVHWVFDETWQVIASGLRRLKWKLFWNLRIASVVTYWNFRIASECLTWERLLLGELCSDLWQSALVDKCPSLGFWIPESDSIYPCLILSLSL